MCALVTGVQTCALPLLLESRWDILCPRCRGAQLSATSLDRLPTRAHCESCNIGYDRDFAHNVELSFRPAPGVRPVAEGEFCLFGPMSTPHVAAQLALGPGERRRVPADFADGAGRYRTLEPGGRSGERRVGTACVSPCRYRGCRHH